MNKYHLLILLATLTCLASSASSRTLDYTYISLDYSKFTSTPDKYTAKLKGNALTLDLSIAVRPNIAFVASYSEGHANTKSSGMTVGTDMQSTSLGALIHLPINKTADFILGTEFINGETKVDATTESEDADGGDTYIGFRAIIAEDFDIHAFIHKTTIENKSNISLSMGLAYFIDERFSINVNSAVNIDGGLLALGIAKHF